MSFDESLIREISILTLLLKEGKIDDAQFDRLENLLQTDRLARQYYVMLVTNDLFLKEADVLSCLETQHEFDLLLELAEYEKTAPSMEIPQVQPQRELVREVVYPPREKHKVSKFNVLILALNAVAILFLVLFVRYAPSKEGVEVASLTNSFDAKWLDVNSSMETGTRLATHSAELCLSEGLVELSFDNDAKVVIEAPAAFVLLAEDRLGLRYGKIYAIVPQQAVGFSVYTENAKVIDLGTEFGIEVNSQGDTYLNVVKGQTQLIAGEKSDILSMIVQHETAIMVSSGTCAVSNISYDDNRFVRSFNSANRALWRQQPLLNLADIVRNGNGLGTGDSQVRLNYLKGFTTDHRGGETLIAEDFLPIKDHPFIDGIFIPNGKTVVSSRGDAFDDFVITSGVHCADLFGNPVPESTFLGEQPKTIQFDGREYSERGKSCIFMPGSNHGITFDLDAIRSRYNLKIDQFTSRVGLVDFNNKRCNTNFYVLVDGQLRYSLLGYIQKGVLNDVSVKLEETDRFLTLATTENVDQIDYMANSTLRENWCVFAEPVLVFK
jgi:hypothetical protein